MSSNSSAPVSIVSSNVKVGSKWTSRSPENREKHFEVVSVSQKAGEAQLRTVLTGSVRKISLEDLANGKIWAAGWL